MTVAQFNTQKWQKFSEVSIGKIKCPVMAVNFLKRKVKIRCFSAWKKKYINVWIDYKDIQEVH